MSDDDTAHNLALIAALSLEDVDSVQAGRKGKAQDGIPLTDEELAFQLYAEEATRFLAFSRDAIVAGSMDKAIEADYALSRAYTSSEAQEARNRNMAFSLSGQTAPPTPAFTSAEEVVSLDDMLDELSVHSVYVPSSASTSIT